MNETIVLIEDEESLKESIRDILKNNYYDPVIAENCNIGIQKIKQQTPDLVLCDFSTFRHEGNEVLQTLRQSDNLAQIPFIFINVPESAEAFRKAMRMGADDFLQKNSGADELLKALAIRLNRFKQIKGNIQKKIDTLKLNISSVYSHEFNTPLNGIIGFTDLLMDYHSDDMDDDMIDMVEAIRVSAKRLHRLTSNLVLFADLQRYDASLNNPEVYKPGITEYYREPLISDIRMIGKMHMREDDIKIEVEEGNLYISYSDLSKIITEAVDNAVKYSEFGYEVTVNSEFLAYYMVFTISDKGYGIDETMITEFESFSNLDQSRELRYGIGLGLYFIYELTRLNNGYVNISSKEGEGTTMYIYLPYFTGRQIAY